jgi:site-specific DNA-methyltransferase (adenine-specific)
MNKHNPDVLSCLANLSNDEVFTPPEIVNKMLDMLPQELFESSETTFLDPCCKTGVFLREIAKRLLKNQMPGYEKVIESINQKAENDEELSTDDVCFKKELQQTIDHIFHKQLFGIAITEMTSLVSRRSVYCSKSPNYKYSISHFDNAEGNIRFKRINHTWVNGKCKFCGANEEQYSRGESLETHAYEWIHTENPEGIFNMKFDVIISNPPYQLSDGSGGSTDAAMPIYQKFIEKAFVLQPKYASMIVPSKWMVGGRGLQNFREKMMNNKNIRFIYDYEDSSECFNGLHIDGGVNYFLWDRDYKGVTEYVYKPKNEKEIKTKRYLKTENFDIIIRDSRRQSIIEKATIENNSFTKIVSPRKPFNINTDLFNCPNKYPELNLKEKIYSNSVLIWGVKGLKGGAKRIQGFVKKDAIQKNIQWVSKYKLFISKAYSTDAIEFPKLIEADQNVICTETFLVIGPFDNKYEQQNCLSYTETKFFKTLLFFGRGTMQVSQEVFRFVPLQDFSKPWTDEELYKKYKFTQEEIDFIESMIRPMEKVTA